QRCGGDGHDPKAGENEGGTSMSQASSAKADLILHNGRVATLDAHKPVAEAVAVLDGKFAAVGTEGEVLKLRSDRTQVIDVGGRAIIPGLNDSHLHLIRGGLYYNMEL